MGPVLKQVRRYASQVATADRATVVVSDHHRNAGHPVSNDSGDILVKDMNSQEILPRRQKRGTGIGSASSSVKSGGVRFGLTEM